jgi:hypothetical protein
MRGASIIGLEMYHRAPDRRSPPVGAIVREARAAAGMTRLRDDIGEIAPLAIVRGRLTDARLASRE